VAGKEHTPCQLSSSVGLDDLYPGDVIVAVNGRRYRKPLHVTDPLGPIEPGSPVRGVRVQTGVLGEPGLRAEVEAEVRRRLQEVNNVRDRSQVTRVTRGAVKR
jgi:hypothetical protein